MDSLSVAAAAGIAAASVQATSSPMPATNPTYFAANTVGGY